MTAARMRRIGGLSGIAFSLLSLAVMPLVAAPTPDAGVAPALGANARELTLWYAAHRTGFLVGNYLGIAAFVPGFVQLALLAARFRGAERASAPWLAGFVLAAGTFTYAIFAASLAVFQVVPFLADGASPQAIHAMGTLGAVWFALDGLAAIPLLVAVGWATLATRALPRWFAHATWVVTALALVMSFGALAKEPAWLAAGGPATVIGFVAFFVWTLILGVLMFGAARRSDLTTACARAADECARARERDETPRKLVTHVMAPSVLRAAGHALPPSCTPRGSRVLALALRPRRCVYRSDR